MTSGPPDFGGQPGARSASSGEAAGGAAHAAGAAAAGRPLDRAAIERLWLENRAWIARVLLAHKPRWTDLEDLLQEVATTIVAKAHTIEDPQAARGWLRTVAVNAARAAARSGQYRDAGRVFAELDGFASGRGGGEGTSSFVPDALDAAVAEDARTDLVLRLDRLPETYREPLLLRTVRGLSSRAIGRMLGISEAAVDTRVARARRMLAKPLEGERHGKHPPGGDRDAPRTATSRPPSDTASPPASTPAPTDRTSPPGARR